VSATTGRRLDGQPDRRTRDAHVTRCGGCGEWQYMDSLCDLCRDWVEQTERFEARRRAALKLVEPDA
jgi:hypothetical protein